MICSVKIEDILDFEVNLPHSAFVGVLEVFASTQIRTPSRRSNCCVATV